jgi:hypothetical protein
MADAEEIPEQDADVTNDDEIVFNIHEHDRGDGIRPEVKLEKPVKIECFSGEKQPWTIWHRMFERIARMNGWKNDLANHMFGLLRGPALEVACGLPDGDFENYESLVTILDGQFGPGRQAGKYLAELRNRAKKDDENFRVLGRDISRLCSLAYPESTYDERQRHAKIYFVDAIPETELRMMISTARPNNLDEAICLAEEFEGIRRLERQRYNKSSGSNRNNVRNVNMEGQNDVRPSETGRLDRIESMIDNLCQDNSRYSRQSRRPGYGNDRYQNTVRRCWGCNSDQHLVRDCPQVRNEKNGGEPGPRDKRRL